MKNALTNREIEAVANAVATQQLEGLDIDPQTQADMDRYARGEIELTDALARRRQRAVAGEFRKERQ